MHNILRKIFGWHQYRIQIIYKSKSGQIVFTVTRTVGVSRRKFIDDHRKIKKELGPIYGTKGVQKHLLNNGTLIVEPVCYLGRWH
jgi:hypothetical protein